MNGDRFVLTAGRGMASVKYTTPRDRNTFCLAQAFLSDAVVPDGCCYKDVVQPFVVGPWLRDHPDVAVLKIMPNVAHVAYAMIRQNWLYPMEGALRGGSVPDRMISGLLRAASMIATVPGEVVSYDELIFDLDPLRRALGSLYPEQDIPPLRHTPEFGGQRDHVLGRRTEEDYQALSAHVTRIRREQRGSAVPWDEWPARWRAA